MSRMARYAPETLQPSWSAVQVASTKSLSLLASWCRLLPLAAEDVGRDAVGYKDGPVFYGTALNRSRIAHCSVVTVGVGLAYRPITEPSRSAAREYGWGCRTAAGILARQTHVKRSFLQSLFAPLCLTSQGPRAGTPASTNAVSQAFQIMA